MADNATFQSATPATPPAGTVVAADDVGSGVLMQRVKLDLGADGASSPLVRGQQADASSIPVTLSTEQAALIDGLETLLTSVKTATEAIETLLGGTLAVSGTFWQATQPISHAALTELAAAIDTEVQVDVVSMPTVTIQDGGNTITVDGTVAVTNAGLTELAAAVHAEDAAHSSGDSGIQILAVRQDAQSDFGADGDYVPLSIDADGQLRVNAGAVTASAASEYTDDEAFTLATDKVTAAGAIRDANIDFDLDAAEGDVVPLRVNGKGALHTVFSSGTAYGGAVFRDNDQPTDTGEPGLPILAVRKDAGGSMVGTDGDWSQLQLDSSGNLRVTSSTLPTGAATSAKQDTVIGHLDGVEGLLTTIDADTGGILTAVQLIDNAISGSEMQVDVVAALPAGNNNIGNMDVESIVPGTAATNLGKAEDAVHASGDVGVMMLGVRQDTQVDFGADGDYVPLSINADGQVRIFGVVDPSGGAVRLFDGSSNVAAKADTSGRIIYAPDTAGGLSTLNATSSDGGTALTNTAQAVKASAGQVYGYYIYNPNATAQFVQFFNTASGSVTVGTTNPLYMLTIPATSAANLMFPHGVTFGTAISVAATSTAGGNGAPGTALDAVVWYK